MDSARHVRAQDLDGYVHAQVGSRLTIYHVLKNRVSRRAGSKRELKSVPDWHQTRSMSQYGNREDKGRDIEWEKNEQYMRFAIVPFRSNQVEADSSSQAAMTTLASSASTPSILGSATI